jgi:phosphoglycolate phosphatase-like HAD superfamily hydrolase
MGESSPKFRKPDTGIIELFRDDFQDPENALMVGDMVTDWECAKKAGIPFIPAETWRMIDGNWLNNLSAIHLPRS